MNHQPTKTRYTVKELAALAGVSIRALHHYDEIGLLKPASVGVNGYRYYGREELLKLQQILFYKELGLSLDAIRHVVNAPGLDRATTLRNHRRMLSDEIHRLRLLLGTIDDSLGHLEGETTMNEEAARHEIDAEARIRQEQWAVERYGKWGRLGIETRDKVVSDWTEADHERFKVEWQSVIADLTAAFSEGLPIDCDRVQDGIQRLHSCTSMAWTGSISRGGFVNMADIYTENPESRAGLDRHLSGLADYVADAMRIFAINKQPWPV